MRDAPADDIVYPPVPAELFFLGTVPILVHKQYVRALGLELFRKIEHPPPPVHDALLHARERFQKVLPLLLRIDGVASLEVLHVLVRADTDDQVAVLCRLGEKCDVPAVKKVKTARNKYFPDFRRKCDHGD